MKKVVLVLLLVVIGFLLIGCTNTSAKIPELCFDDFVTWDSTFDDIVKHYGDLKRVQEIEGLDYEIMINNKAYKYDVYSLEGFTCCGYSGFTLSFRFLHDTGELIFIMNSCSTPDMKMLDDIEGALVSKYGKPSVHRQHKVVDAEILYPADKYHSEWKGTIKDTNILCVYQKRRENNNGYFQIEYSRTNLTSPSSRKMDGI